MGDDGKIVIELIAKDQATQQFVTSLKTMSAQAKTFEADTKGALGGVGTGFDATLSKVKTFAVGLVAAFASMSTVHKFWDTFKETAAAELALTRMATRLGTTAEILSGLQYAGKKAGVDMDTFDKSVQRMVKNISAAALGAEEGSGKFDEMGEEIGKGGRALRELGLDAQVLNTLPLNEQLKALSYAFQRIPSEADKVRLALEIFGMRSGGGMLVMMKQGAEAIDVFIQRGRELGVVLDNDVAQRGAAAGKSLNEMKDAVHGFAIIMTDKAAPAITSGAKGLTELLIEVRTGVVDINKLAEAFKNLGPAISYMTEKLSLAVPGLNGVAALINIARIGGELMPKGGDISAKDVFGPAGPQLPPPYIPPPGVVIPPVRGSGEKPDKGGAGGQQLSTLMSALDQLKKEYASLTQGMNAQVDEWAQHMINKIKGVDEVITDPAKAQAEALALVPQVAAEKKKKNELDFTKWFAGEMGQRERLIEINMQEELRKAGVKNKGLIAQVEARQKAILAIEQRSELLGQQKGYMDTLAGSAPLLSQQLAIQQKILPLQNEMDQLALKKFLTENNITGAQADELRGLEALAEQARKYALQRKQWEIQGPEGGLKMWGMERLQGMETQMARGMVEAMKGLERMMGDALGTAIWSGLIKHEKGWGKQLGESIGQSFVKMAATGLMKVAFDMIAKHIIAPLIGEATIKALTGGSQMAATLANTLALNANTIAHGGTIAASAANTGGLLANTGATIANTAETIWNSLCLAWDAVTGFFGFHEGGILTAHAGLNLNPDERLIKGLVGEGIVSRFGMSRLGAAGFDMVNRGELPMVPVSMPVGGGGGGGTPLVVNVNHNPTYYHNHPITDADIKRHGKVLTETVATELRRSGKFLGS